MRIYLSTVVEVFGSECHITPQGKGVHVMESFHHNSKGGASTFWHHIVENTSWVTSCQVDWRHAPIGHLPCWDVRGISCHLQQGKLK